MHNILFETTNSERFFEVKTFFERHLVSVLNGKPLAFERNPATYADLDALLVSVGECVTETAYYLEQIVDRLNCPAITISDRVLAETEETHLLESGAADCVCVPFGLRELLARVRARSRRFQISKELAASPNFRFSSFALNSETRTLLTRQNSVKLAKKEFSLLSHFLRNNYAGIPRDELLTVVSAENLDVADRSIDSMVSRLRDRFQAMGARGDLIQTIRGFGYSFRCGVTSVARDVDLRASL